MLDLAFNPYVDQILKDHVLRQARQLGLSLSDLEDVLDSEADAIEWLKEASISAYEGYLEDADNAVNHIGWIVTPLGLGERESSRA